MSFVTFKFLFLTILYSIIIYPAKVLKSPVLSIDRYLFLFQIYIVSFFVIEKLQICIEKIEDIMGSAYQEREMVNAVIHNNFNVEAALDTLLNKSMCSQTRVYISNTWFYFFQF